MRFPHVEHDIIQQVVNRQLSPRAKSPSTPRARTNYYEIKSGKYAGMYHVRRYSAGRYFHIGRFWSLDEVHTAIANPESVKRPKAADSPPKQRAIRDDRPRIMRSARTDATNKEAWQKAAEESHRRILDRYSPSVTRHTLTNVV